MAKSLIIGVLFVAALALAAPTPTQNIVQLAAGIPDLSTLVTALKAGNLVTALSGAGPFTVFAPTNEAFAALPKATLASLLEPKNIKELQSILEYHVIAGAAVRAEDLKASQDVKTLEGQEVHINKISGSVTVQNAKVITADVGATNGVVHVINGVLTPPKTFGSAVQPIQDSSLPNIFQLASNEPALSTFVTAVKAAGLQGFIGGDEGLHITVFAPTNEAFAKLPKAQLSHLLEPANINELKDILSFHCLPATLPSKDLKARKDVKEDSELTYAGNRLYFTSFPDFEHKALLLDYKNNRGAGFVTAVFVDLQASNGILHVIDRVLIPGHPIEPASGRTIVELISRDPELSTLVTALTAAKLTDTLSADNQFTLFAPTNKAFSLLPAKVLADLLDPADIGPLVTLLEYHVLSGGFRSKDLLITNDQQNKLQAIRQETLEGRNLIFQNPGVLLVNDAVATFVDLQASNGIVHVIDQVLLPTFTSDRDIMEVIASYPQLSTFTTALKAGGYDGLSNLGQVLAGNGVLQRFKPIWDGFVHQCAYGTRGKSIFHVPSKSAQCPFTVFAPTNEAFAKLPKATLERLLCPDNIAELQDILELHIVPGDAFEVQRIRAQGAFRVDLNERSLGQFVSSLDGQLNSYTTGDAFFIDQNVVNGTTLLSAGIFYEYPDHVPKQMSSVILGDVANLGASNGIVHMIDSVLIPIAPTQSIVESLNKHSNGQTTTFVAALKAANLERSLNDAATGPYTVFAPTNEAFAALPGATLKHLLDPRNIGELQDLLEYHIVAGFDLRVGCANIGRNCDPKRDLEGFKGPTLMGKKVTVTLVGEAGIDGSIKIDKSNVIAFENSAYDGTGQANNRASNGNWILIDQVLTKHYMPTLV